MSMHWCSPGAPVQVFNIYAERPDEEVKPDSWHLVAFCSASDAMPEGQ